ncbi:hypothetical protein HJC23_009391 [Cyclotella cryptica]|uniref:Uncharacterized protein n=1 Tax=Cyclotella cryptica TaxID=29204 RepID=A0ABD3PXJ7_9STRA
MNRLFQYWSGTSDADDVTNESEEDVAPEEEEEAEHDKNETEEGCDDIDDDTTDSEGAAGGIENDAAVGINDSEREVSAAAANDQDLPTNIHPTENIDSTIHPNNDPSDAHNFVQINDDLVLPQTIPTPSITNEPNPPLSNQNVPPTNPNDVNQEEYDDSFPKAKDFLADLLFHTEPDDENENNENGTLPIPPEQATEIVCGFNNNNDNDEEDNTGNNDARTVHTHRTTGTVLSTASRRVLHSSTIRRDDGVIVMAPTISREHFSIFDILERNLQELGDCRGGVEEEREIGYRDVKLCFVAFVVVFALPSDAVVVASGSVDGVGATDHDLRDGNDGDEGHGVTGTAQGNQHEQSRKNSRPSVPLSVAFALWRQVLRLPHRRGKDDSTTLSYIRSTLVLLGLLELSSIDREDAPVAPVAGRSRYQNKSASSIECLRVHHDINQQYGEYLAWGDHDGSFRSIIEQHQRQWNNAVMKESLQLDSNEFTIRMLPLNTMRAYHMQDTFDLLKDKSFVRHRVRFLGVSDAAAAHIRDVDELLRLIDHRVKANDSTIEAVDEQDGVLSAYEQMKKYCLHVANELTKRNATTSNDGENKTESISSVAGLGKAALLKISDAGNALHLLGASLGGYGFFDEEMEYYKEALRLKELCAKGKAEQFVAVSDTLHCMGFSLDNAGKSEEALEYYDRALDIRLQYLGDDDLRVADTLHNKGALLCEAERSDEAMECLEEALRIRELHYGEEHESCADTMQWMGNLLRKYGDPSDALDYFKFSLRIKQTRLGADHIDVANTLFNTAVLLDDVEKYELSLIAYKEACRIRKLVLGEKSRDVADTLFCLGNVATAMEKHEEALEYFNESISILEALIKGDDMYCEEKEDCLLFVSHPYSMNPGLLMQYQKLIQCFEEVLPLTKLIFGTNHEDVCKLLIRMGDVYRKLHDWDNAIGSFQGALRVKRANEVTEEDNVEIAAILQRKGEAHLYKSEFSRAKSTFDAALQIREKALGRESIPFASSLYCLGTAYYNLKDYQHSRLLFQECMRIQTKLLGKDDLVIAQSLCWLGRNHRHLNEATKALEKYLSALQLCKKNRNAVDYRIVVMLLNAIGKTYEDEQINVSEMALKCYLEEIHLIETKLDTEDERVTRLLALAHYKVGMIFQQKEDVAESIEHLEQGLNLTKKYNEDNRDSTEAMITDTLGMLYASRQEYDAAKKYLSESYSLYEKTFGREHLTTSDCAFRLAECLEHVGSNLALDFYEESLRVRRLNVSDDDERVGTLLFCIGRLHFSKGSFIDAANSFDEALNTRRKLLGDCPTVADTYHQLANSYAEMKHLEKALIFYKESVRILKKLGEKNSLYTVSLDTAKCCESMGDFLLAIECYNDCLQATEELNDNENIAFVLQRMGEIHMSKLDNYAEAIKLFLDALELLQAEGSANLSDENQISVLGMIFQIGQAYTLAKEFENALSFYEEHIKLAESMEPVNDEVIGNSLFEMGSILAEMDNASDYESAIEKLSECLDIRRNLLGSDNEQVATVLHKLALVYEKIEEYDKAVDCLSEALRTFKMKQNTSDASATYHTLAKLKASAAEKSGSDSDRKAAIECYEAAISTRRQDPALADLELASILYEYATLLCLDNSYINAMPLLEEALRIQKSKQGLKDERVANILLRTAECHVHNNKYDSSLVCLEQALFIQSSLESCEIDMVLLNHLLGITYLERGDYAKAISTSLSALKIMKMESSEDSLECADVYTNLGKAYGKVHEYDNAIESLVEALRIQKVELGNDSLEYAESVFNLAEIHVATNKHSQSLICLEESIRVFEMTPDEESALVDALEMAATCHFIMKDFCKAASRTQQCIHVIESQITDKCNDRLASLWHKLGKCHASSKDYDNAFSSYRKSIKLYSEAFGPDNLHVASVMLDVGRLTLDDNEAEKAAQCFTEVIRIYTMHGEQNNIKVADALVQLGTIHADSSRLDEGMEAVKKAMRLYKEQLGDDAVELGMALLLCGRLNDLAGDYNESMSNFSDSLHIFRTSLGENDMNVSLALSNIGVAHARKQEYSEAVEKCKEALRIRKLHTDNDQDVADSLFNIGNLLNEWGNYEDAIPYLEGSLKLYRSLLGDEDITIALCQQKLGAVYLKMNDIEHALDSFSEGLYVCEQVDEEVDHEHLLSSFYKGLGDCYLYEEDLDSALESFVACLKIQKELGDDYIEMGDTCNCIGLVYQKSGRHDEAMHFYRKSLKIYETHHGQSSSQGLATHIQISEALLSEEKYKDAIDHLNECVQVYSKEGRDFQSDEVAIIYNQLGIAQNKLGKHDEAIASLNKAIDIRTNIRGKNDLKVAETMLDLGDVLQERADANEALAVYDEAISILKMLPESNQIIMADVYSRIAEILTCQNKYELSLNTLKCSLKLYSGHYGSDSIKVAETLLQLGHVYNHLDNLEKATGCLLECIKFFRSNPSERNVHNELLMSDAMNRLGKIYARKKVHNKAIELCTESLRIQRQYSSKENFESIAATCVDIGNILSEWDKSDQALQFYEESLRLYEKNSRTDSIEVATCYHGIALANKRMGKSEAALMSFGKALRIHRTKEGDKSLHVANDLFQIGQIYDSFGDTSKAFQCFKECLKTRQDILSDDDLDVLAARRYVDTLRRKLHNDDC